jgi:hypothetical protein
MPPPSSNPLQFKALARNIDCLFTRFAKLASAASGPLTSDQDTLGPEGHRFPAQFLFHYFRPIQPNYAGLGAGGGKIRAWISD